MLRAHLIYGTTAAILAVACGYPAHWAFVGDGGCKSDAESLLVRKTGSIDECYNLCSTTSGCVGFEYFTKKALAGRCQLQSELALQSTEKGGKFGVQCYNMVLSTSPTLPEPNCKAVWTSPEDGVNCTVDQYGCPAACDDDEYQWCMVTDETWYNSDPFVQDYGWKYCGAERPEPGSGSGSPSEAPEERFSCGGDRYTFDTGFGGCETYAPGFLSDYASEENYDFCELDFDAGLLRPSDVCDECGHCVSPPRSFDAFRLVGDGRLRDAAQKGFASAATIKTMTKIKTFEACGQGCVLHNEQCSAYPNAPKCRFERRRCNGFEYTPSKRTCLLKGGLFDAATINAGNEKVQSYVLKTCADSAAFSSSSGSSSGSSTTTAETLVSQSCTFVTNAGDRHHVAGCVTAAESCSPRPPPAMCDLNQYNNLRGLFGAMSTIEGGEMPCGALLQAGAALEEGESSMGISACGCYNLIPSDHPDLAPGSVVDCAFSASDPQTVLQSILYCHAVRDAAPPDVEDTFDARFVLDADCDTADLEAVEADTVTAFVAGGIPALQIIGAKAECSSIMVTLTLRTSAAASAASDIVDKGEMAVLVGGVPVTAIAVPSTATFATEVVTGSATFSYENIKMQHSVGLFGVAITVHIVFFLTLFVTAFVNGRRGATLVTCCGCAN